MWQVLTQKQPFAGRNFMGVLLDVLKGRQPQIPQECPKGFKKTIKQCWHDNPTKRPTMEEVVHFFESAIQEGGEGGAEP